jgi:hypothetical protein
MYNNYLSELQVLKMPNETELTATDAIAATPAVPFSSFY